MLTKPTTVLNVVVADSPHYLGGRGGARGAGDGRLQVPDVDAWHLEGEAALAAHLGDRHSLAHPVDVLHLLL